jgi:hypothetical protein
MRAPPRLDTGRAAGTRKGWPLCLAPWRVRQQAQEREDRFHPQGLDPRPGESRHWNGARVNTDGQGAVPLSDSD